MRNFLAIFAVAAFLIAGNAIQSMSYAQVSSPEIAGALSRLKNNPRYQGRILGTHVKQRGKKFLYEVRILRPDDRVILVYIDPQTGGVIGDSERRNQRRAKQPNQRRNDFGDWRKPRNRDNPGVRRGFGRQ